MIKVLLLNPTMAPRSIEIFNLLAKEKNINLTVFYYSVSEKNRRWMLNSSLINFNYEILRSFNFAIQKKDYYPFNISYNFLQKLTELDPDVVIVPGWIDLSSYISAIYCKLQKKKLILRSESTLYEKSWRRTFFMPFTKLMVKAADTYTVSGTRAKKYLIKLGADKKKIFVGYSTVDIKRFARDSKLGPAEHKRLRGKLGIKEKDKVIMFNGQLIIRKGIYDLIEAFRRLSKKHKNTKLLIVGYGQEQNRIKLSIKGLDLDKKIVLTGFVKNVLLPKYYAISDVFVLPSREETWGIVVNEAMACGLSVVVGHKVGSSEDLVQHKKNGLIFRSGSVVSLYKALDFMLSDNIKMKLMAKNAASHIRKFNLEGIALAITKAIRCTTNK